MPADKPPRPEDTARIDIRELAASADEAGRQLLLLTIEADELPGGDDAPSTPPSPLC